MKILISLFLLFSLSFVCPVRAELTSEKLGFSKDDKILIIHADDIGMSHSVNRAALDLFKFGLVKSGSIMTPCPWIKEVRTLLDSIPNVDLGIHNTLTSEWKYYKWSPLSQSPGLRDPLGYFWPTLGEAVRHASSQEVMHELEAQINFAQNLGIKPTHLDSHMGVHFARPDYLKGVVALSKIGRAHV
mgnify:FL=1